jgi:formyltetrahydrofolate deformylase
MSHFILTATCPDRIGINAAVSSFLSNRDCNILDFQQYTDQASGTFFLRVAFSPSAEAADRAVLVDAFLTVANRFDMRFELHDSARKARVLMMVSKIGHCMNDILFRYRAGILPIEIPVMVSNHTTFAQEAQFHDIPFVHLPVTTATKTEQEDKLWDLVEEHRIDLVILARYMQVLSEKSVDRLKGRAINIHHSFLPSFKGAKPYHQAYDRGVKLIGATAHYVTADLDEGPIIEQEVSRVDHTMTPNILAAIGRDVERVVFQRAIKAHIEHRVLLNGTSTVVFP